MEHSGHLHGVVLTTSGGGSVKPMVRRVVCCSCLSVSRLPSAKLCLHFIQLLILLVFGNVVIFECIRSFYICIIVLFNPFCISVDCRATKKYEQVPTNDGHYSIFIEASFNVSLFLFVRAQLFRIVFFSLFLSYFFEFFPSSHCK